MGWKERAIGVLEYMIAKNPGRTDAVTSLSAFYSINGQHTAAVSLCTRYLLINPADQEVLGILADTQFELHEFPAARVTYRKVLASDPANSIACSRLLEMEAEPEDEAGGPREIYEAALRANPDSPCLNRLVARFFLKQQRHSPEALSVYQRALLAEPGNIALELACAQACWEQKNFEEAITQAKKGGGTKSRGPSGAHLMAGYKQGMRKAGGLLQFGRLTTPYRTRCHSGVRGNRRARSVLAADGA